MPVHGFVEVGPELAAVEVEEPVGAVDEVLAGGVVEAVDEVLAVGVVEAVDDVLAARVLHSRRCSLMNSR